MQILNENGLAKLNQQELEDYKNALSKSIAAVHKELDGKNKQLNSVSAAIVMHELLCSHNHTDGCGWHYEFDHDLHNWNGSAHKEWNEKAAKLLRVLKEEFGVEKVTKGQLQSLCKVMRGY